MFLFRVSMNPWKDWKAKLERAHFFKVQPDKGQLISKWFFEVVDFLQKMNENNSHTSKNEFIRSFFGGNRPLQKTFSKSTDL